VSCRFSKFHYNDLLPTCCLCRQLPRLRGSFGETCAMEFGHFLCQWWSVRWIISKLLSHRTWDKLTKNDVALLNKSLLTATGCHFSYGITQGYLSSNTSEHTPVFKSPCRPSPSLWAWSDVIPHRNAPERTVPHRTPKIRERVRVRSLGGWGSGAVGCISPFGCTGGLWLR